MRSGLFFVLLSSVHGAPVGTDGWKVCTERGTRSSPVVHTPTDGETGGIVPALFWSKRQRRARRHDSNGELAGSGNEKARNQPAKRPKPTGPQGPREAGGRAAWNPADAPGRGTSLPAHPGDIKSPFSTRKILCATVSSNV